MAFCKNCGAELQDGVKFCGECGARVNSETPVPVRQATVSPAEEQPAIPQPVWAQFVGQTEGQPNGYTAPQTFYVPKRPLGKGGGVTMIVFGAIMITIFLISAISIISEGMGRRYYSSGDIAAPVLALTLTLFAGGLLLLLFGIRKIKNVNRYNANL